MPSQVFFITGTSSGFGNELVKNCLQEGDKVVATSRNSSKLSFPQGTNDTLLTLDCDDCTDRQSVEKALADAVAHFGRVDVVVNNAGYGRSGEFEAVTDVQARRQMDINFFGVMHVTQQALRVMRDLNRPCGGRILQITSMGGQIGVPTFSIYCASKWAVEGLTETMAKEVNPEWNIHLTNVESGGFRTEWAGGSMEFADRHPAYDHINARENMAKRHGTQAGDPVKGARAFWDVAKMDKPPLRVAIGSDAYSVIEQKLKDYSSSIAGHKELSNSTDVDGYKKPS